MTRTEELQEQLNAERDAKYALQDQNKQLVELVRLQHSALEFASDFIPTSCCKIGDCVVCKAIEAFNNWDSQ